ncbi:MAG: hypothetical protein A2787_02590 [Omnitrophica WOR_2 bacterium RIFCSPHIGHO2_01_FULL_48_9]|nr:MAG: hypothetical protein A2787_02590 [Omnitrophica WOR_2 bacterium RIFCSPHIGHO2_01_FULL_48_9]
MLLATNVFAADSFSIDLSHSTIGFTATHLTVSKVNGQFTDYVGTIEFDPQDLASFKADVVIKTASVNTGVNDRDDHLRKEEFFDAPKYPTITFKSSLLEKKDEGYVLRGDLTIRDVTKQVAIPVTISGPVKSPYGQQVIGLVGRFTINRQDFGVKWNKIMDNGGFVVGDDVDILVNVEASK